MRFARAALIAALLSATTGSALAAARSIVNLADGRLLAVVSDGGSLSSRSVNGRHHIDADGIVIDFTDGKLMVDGEAREVPPFSSMLEIRIADGEVEVVGDP